MCLIQHTNLVFKVTQVIYGNKQEWNVTPWASSKDSVTG